MQLDKFHLFVLDLWSPVYLYLIIHVLSSQALLKRQSYDSR